MVDSFLYSRIQQNFQFTFTPEQEKALQNLVGFILSGRSDQLFLLKGFAGTGKSSLIGAVVKTLHGLEQTIVLLTPTGRAAKVFSAYSDFPASTIHRKIYRQKSMFSNLFSVTENRHKDTLFLVDEASMIANDSNDLVTFGSGSLLDDLIEYVYSGVGCKLVLIGDTAQLPPVGQTISPALEKERLEGYSLEVIEMKLTEVVRQATESGILSVASSIRKDIEQDEVFDYPILSVDGMKDVTRLPADELVETINACYDRDGIDDVLVLCRSNKNANVYNRGIRGRILYKEEEIESGDRLMVVRNNYFWKQTPDKETFIANGDLVELKRVKRRTEMYGFHFADVSLSFVDYDMELDAKILLDTLHTEAPSLTAEMRTQLFEAVYADYAANYKTKKEIMGKLRMDPWLNALQIKYAYAMTCHKAQGGQWKHVFVDQGYLTQEMLGMDYYRWLYTAFTRATEHLYLVNFSDECFQ
ncbi:MAG: AAA family ATPase [Bacteroidales bacterium]|nr:AAA family ATPase [Bacteroidales bacterium]